jgi:hypothetical protein
MMTLLTPLERKLLFCEPSSTLGVTTYFNAESRTYGRSSKRDDGRGEKRYDYLMRVTTGASRVLHLAIELVSTADIVTDSLRLKVADMIARTEDHSGARATMLVVYLDKDKPLAHLVLVRQIVNALVVNSHKLKAAHLTVYTSGLPGNPEAAAGRWDFMRREAGVMNTTSMRHLPSSYVPVDLHHDFKYCIHPKEVDMLKKRTGFFVSPQVWAE